LILIRQHGETGPPGLLGEWLETRGLAYEISDSRAAALPDPRDYTAVASLGCRYCPADTDVPQVAGELRLIEQAVAHDVPVLGLCFGGQVLAKVLGGEIERAPMPELGWREIQTDEPDAVPAGPWLLWHYERFTTPPGAREVARTKDATQAFRYGRHLGVQFHPESTVEIVAGWARKDAERLRALGIEDGSGLIAAPAERKAAARDAAFRLFDAFRGESE
jgi:GMP synthase-like glutamine amidotransferase